MTVHFHIHYFTHPGQELALCGNTPTTGAGSLEAAPAMHHKGDGHWELELELEPCVSLTYHYLVREVDKVIRFEWGRPHSLDLPVDVTMIRVNDYWQPEPESPLMASSAFSDSLLTVPDAGQTITYEGGHLILKVNALQVRKHLMLGLSGDTNLLGNWDPKLAIPLSPGDYPEWGISLDTATLPPVFHYKFVLLDRSSMQVVAWEWGEPRELHLYSNLPHTMQVDAGLTSHCQDAPWRGAGLAIPVFSLRSQQSWGCGDFGDLLHLIDWAVETNQQLIQLLPINDTTYTGTWEDSYPYNAISVHALHPLYLAPAQLPPLKDTVKAVAIEEEGQRLNELTELDYEAAWRLKKAYIETLVAQEKESILLSDEYQTFYQDHQDWLDPYAAYAYLRDSQPSPCPLTWGPYSQGTVSIIATLCDPSQPWHDRIELYRIVQYLLHVQLKQVRDYAHTCGVILKGDIPIGVNRYGVEAWHQPELFDTTVQLGAPPDSFSLTGQNWGFPSYNWARMAEDDYRWWKRRFTHLAQYMDAYRIDHILGFFRIWEIPDHAVRGLLGQFNPAMPYSPEELEAMGCQDSDDLTIARFSLDTLKSLFGASIDRAMAYVKKGKGGLYELKTASNTQQKIKALLNKQPADTDLQEGLYSLCEEVLFLRDAKQPNLLHPRINGMSSYRFNALPTEQQTVYHHLHDVFYYRRHNDFWKEQALTKLTPLVQATRMLACGEDLGMIPDCVPEVMNQLQLLSLEIQRMPKRMGARFENLNAIPYLSVCTTSTHDLSPLRAWWTEDPEATAHYYRQMLWKPGATPIECTPEIARDILAQHLASPAMWVIIPWQDWMAMEPLLRNPDPAAERINQPANPRHYWRYRMHLSLETLMEAAPLNTTLRELIQRSGR